MGAQNMGAHTGAASLRQLLFDVGVHRLGKGALDSDYHAELDQDVFLKEPEAALAGVGWSDGQVLVDGPLGQRDAIRVTLGDQPAQDSQAVIQVRHRANMRPDSQLGQHEVEGGMSQRFDKNAPPEVGRTGQKEVWASRRRGLGSGPLLTATTAYLRTRKLQVKVW